jgi:hypothetical protein
MSERWGKGKCRRFRQRCQPHSPRTVGALFADATPFLDPCQREGQRGQIRVHLQNSKLDYRYCTFQHNLHFPPRSSRTHSKLMESPLHQVWESAVGNPFVPTVGKGSHFFLGFTLLTIGLLLSGLFGLSMSSLF